jgi:hypothetical protein
MRIVLRHAVILLFAASNLPLIATAQVDRQRAAEYFKEAQALCERDNGQMWGVSLCGPMVIGDMRTGTFATSEPAPAEPRPAFVGMVNAPVEWGGTTWGAYVWDFAVNETPRGRNELLLHELFHRVQARLGLAVPSLANEHLDTVDGRYWLRLEWRALTRALTESGDQRKSAVGDALAFRQARRALYPSAAESERSAEIAEGLAQYTATAVAASSPSEATASARDQLAAAEKQESFVRMFAYSSGAAYGLLLDASSPGWRRKVRGTDDLGRLVMQALVVQPASNATAAAAYYGGAELRTAEEQREQQRQERVADLRKRFVDGPVLLIQGGGRGSSDARGAVALQGIGTVFFGTYRFSGESGTLEAENGVLVTSDGGSRRVPAPMRRDDRTVYGDGWTFTAAPGWVVREGTRPGDYEVVRQ